MLPLSLLNAAQGHPMLVELKNGETLNGHLISCDTWMNLTLKEVVQTSPEGDKFFRLPEVYVRGNNIKYLRVPDEIIDLVKEQQQNQPSNRGRGGGPQRGDHGGRGDRGRGGARGASGRGRGRGYENFEAEKILKRISKSAVWEELHIASSKGDFIRVQKIVRILVTVHGEPPSPRLYTALILANASPQHGTVQEVEAILREMVEEGLSLDSAAYHAVLKVLAIHPDYILRNEILDQLRAKWFPLTSDGWHDLVISCLRERQVEMALDYLEQMRTESIRVHPWFHDLFAYCFCDTGDFDEVLKLMCYRLDNAELEISPTLWYYILDTASRSHHHEATLCAWRKHVEPGYLNPPTGVTINVLNTAARHGDFRLATDVFRILGQRTNSLQIFHYEALFEAYLTAGDHRTALSVLPLMIAANIPPTDATVRPLYLYLRQSPELPHKALHTLQQLKKADKVIPTVAVNAIIEAAISTNDLNLAIDTYKTLHTLSSTGPTISTFNALFRGCSKAGRKDTAMFLAAEMLALKVPPDALTYDRLILVCIEGKTQEDYDDAFKYFEEMKEMSWWPRRGTLVAMAKRFCERGDERVWGLVEEMEARGMDVGSVQRWVGENWRAGEERRRMWREREKAEDKVE